MEKYFSDYCLVCDELLQANQKNWKKLQEFTDTLFTHVGFPNQFVEMGLYLGNYRQTPFGVHVDGCGVFSFPVIGKKTFRLWKSEFGKQHPELDRAHDYSALKKNSQILIGHGELEQRRGLVTRSGPQLGVREAVEGAAVSLNQGTPCHRRCVSGERDSRHPHVAG